MINVRREEEMSGIGDLYEKERRKREELKRQQEKEARARQVADQRKAEEERRLQVEREREYERIKEERERETFRLLRASGVRSMLSKLKWRHGIKVVDQGFGWIAAGKVVKSEWEMDETYYTISSGECAGIHSRKLDKPRKVVDRHLHGVTVVADGAEGTVTVEGPDGDFEFSEANNWAGLAERLTEQLAEGIANEHTVLTNWVEKRFFGLIEV